MFQKTKCQEGVLSDQDIEALISKGFVRLSQAVRQQQIQPASLDLRLGYKAYRVCASFISGENSSVQEKLKALSLYELDITEGAILERDCVYIIELLESLSLPEGIAAAANPKSSTGRLNVFTRILYDHAKHYDKLPKGYHGPLYIELCPKSFPIKVRTGSSLAQMRFYCGQPRLTEAELLALQKQESIVNNGHFHNMHDSVSLSIDLSGKEKDIIGYRAKRHTAYVDVDAPESAEREQFWDPIYKKKSYHVILDPQEFYIFASQEKVYIPPLYAAEMKPFVAEMGEFRVHYAGFFDPGFGMVNKKGQGSKAVLEVCSRDLPFIVEHGQPIAHLFFEHMLNRPNKLYGEALRSNYQSQGLKLSKHFRDV